eukprot:m.88518 g.88518  ORF g.88518 m.88518 type:complete len:75 (-) comp12864_c0_seq2:1742-1966(-)
MRFSTIALLACVQLASKMRFVEKRLVSRRLQQHLHSHHGLHVSLAEIRAIEFQILSSFGFDCVKSTFSESFINL